MPRIAPSQERMLFEEIGERAMRVGLMTREYPPEVYGGAGVHVEYLSRELAKLIEVEAAGDWSGDRGGLFERDHGLQSGCHGLRRRKSVCCSRKSGSVR